VEETDYDGWADLAAQRQAEDEALVQKYAAGEGRGQDMRPVRGFVRHVRRDIGPKGVICKVQMTTQEHGGHEIVVWYYYPQKGTRASAPKTATSTEPPSGGAPAPGGLAALARPSVAPPPASPPPASPATPPAGPARRGTATASG
jgi:hypothetical protein